MRSLTEEHDVLAAARSGGEEAFRRLVEPHRSHLHAHCYRMLGSFHDADDVLQEVLVRAWRGLPRFDGRSAFRTWLYRIATNACLDAIAGRPKRVLPIDYGPAAASVRIDSDARSPGVGWIEPYPDEVIGVQDGYASPEARYEQREAVELAFVAALQYLPPRQRAVLILRDVLGLSAREVADALETTVASVNSALQRARKAVDERVPDPSQQATVRSLGDEQVREIVERFSDAFERGDTSAILALLAEDATFSMPPHPDRAQGRDAIAESWLMPTGPVPRLRYVRTHANGQIAVAAYLLTPDRSRYEPLALDVLTLRGAAIVDVVAFRTPELFASFRLPAELAA